MLSSATRELWWCLRCFLYIAGGSCGVQLQETYGDVWGASYTLQAGHVEFSYERLMVMFEVLLIHCRRVMWSSATRDFWWCLRCFLYIAGGPCGVQLRETYGDVWGASYTLQAGHVEFSYERLMVMFDMLLIHCRRVMWSSATRDLWWCLRYFLYIAGGSCGVQLRENYGDVWDASYTLQAGHVEFSYEYERLMVMFEVLLIHYRRAMWSSATRDLWWGDVWGASYTLQAGHVEFSYERLMVMFEVLLIHCRRAMWSSATRDFWRCLRCFLYIAGGPCGVQLRETYGDVWGASYTLQAGHVEFSYERLLEMFEVLLIHCRRAMWSSAMRDLWWCLRCFLYIAGGPCGVQLRETFGDVWGASYTLQAGHVEFSYERLMVMFEVLLIHCRRVMWSSATRDFWRCLRCFLYIAGRSCGVQLRETYGDVWGDAQGSSLLPVEGRFIPVHSRDQRVPGISRWVPQAQDEPRPSGRAQTEEGEEEEGQGFIRTCFSW